MLRVKKHSNEKPSIWFTPFIIETPKGKKFEVLPVFAYAPDYKRWGVLANAKLEEEWYGRLIDLIPELEAMPEFFEANFRAAQFLSLLKKKGYKIYWHMKTARPMLSAKTQYFFGALVFAVLSSLFVNFALHLNSIPCVVLACLSILACLVLGLGFAREWILEDEKK